VGQGYLEVGVFTFEPIDRLRMIHTSGMSSCIHRQGEAPLGVPVPDIILITAEA